jgi:hypothetical protein
MEYTIMFYRSQEWAQRWERVGVYKPEGMACSGVPYRSKVEATLTAEHVNAHRPEHPCVVIEVK